MVRIPAIFALCLALLLPAAAHATAQAPDRITFDGEEHSLHNNPLWPHLDRIEWTLPEEAVTNSALWRGYVAYWEIADGELRLLDAKIFTGDFGPRMKERSILRKLFRRSRPPILADWYSGALVVPQGKVVEYVHMGYESVYERYVVFRIAEGKVLERLDLSHEEFARFKEAKFEAFRQTDEFRTLYEERRAKGGYASEESLLEAIRRGYAERYMGL